MQISTTANPSPVDDARLAEILANPGQLVEAIP